MSSAIEVKKREGETPSSLIFRFSKRVRESGILREARKRRFKEREPNKRKKLLSALHREKKRMEIEKQRKLGVV